MTFQMDGAKVFVAQGGKAHDQNLPLVIFIHGAGMDHSVWALQSRWFAHHGARVAAIDLPGHGGSAGPELKDIGALADWTARLIAAFGEAPATLVGHSMGALIALETAAKHPSRVAAIALPGAAGKMPVSGDLLLSLIHISVSSMFATLRAKAVNTASASRRATAWPTQP